MTDCVIAPASKIRSFVTRGTSTDSRKTILKLWKENPSRRERRMFGLAIIGALGALLLLGSFTALQFRWLAKIARA
jgi:hypothetical protein